MDPGATEMASTSARSGRCAVASSARLLRLCRHLRCAAPTLLDVPSQSGPASAEGAGARAAILGLLDGGARAPLPVDPASGVPELAAIARIEAATGLGRIVAFYYRSSTSDQIR
jgi:hypothetical protein